MADKQKAQPRPWKLGEATEFHYKEKQCTTFFVLDAKGELVVCWPVNQRLLVSCVNSVTDDKLEARCIEYLEALGYAVERDSDG